MKLNYHSSGRDLYADPVSCTCPSPLFKGSDIEHLMPNKVRLSGYADNNFFDNVHKEPQNGACNCGRKFKYQWFRSHVDFEWEE